MSQIDRKRFSIKGHRLAEKNGGSMLKVAGSLFILVLVMSFNIHEVRSEDVYLHAPKALRFEHDQLQADLKALTKLDGEVGKAAKKLKLMLRPHLHKEERFALPQLGVLNEIVEGKKKVDSVEVAKLSKKLEEEMPFILSEHKAVVKSLDALAEAGKLENIPEAEYFVERLRIHAKYEEEVFYPAAILASKYLMLKAKEKKPV